MRYEIQGQMLPTLDIYLNHGEAVYSESSSMAWMIGDMELQTTTRGGIVKGLARSLTGDSMFQTTYTCTDTQALITFASSAPGTILPVELAGNEVRICQRNTLLAATGTLQLEPHYQRQLGAAFYGREGFVLQKLIGPGVAWVEMAGGVRNYSLTADQTIKISPGHLAMYEPTVTHRIERLPGVKNMLFGGDSVFLASLTGPGMVWVQSLPLANLAGRLAQLGRKQSSS